MAKLWLIPTALLLTLVVFYTRTAPVSRADFVYVNSSDVHTLDPVRMSWTPDFRVALNLWEGLTSWDPRDNSVIGAAADFPPNQDNDGLTYRFTIRDDARWSNGDPVTSDDFLRGWRRAIEPGSAADYSYLLTDHIAGAKDYARWRSDGVAVLTALERLCQGKCLTPQQERALSAFTADNPIRERFAYRSEDDVLRAERGMAEHLSEIANPDQLDWCSRFDEYFESHVAEMEARFLRVGLEAPDAQTFVVHLTAPCPYFLDITGMPVFLPCHKSIERLRTRDGAAPITRQGLVIYDPQWTKPDYHAFGYPGLVTNGSYRMTEWTFKRRLLLEANRFHRDASRLACKTVEMRVYENVNAAIMAYEAGDVDFLPNMTVSYDHEIARLARSGERPDFHLCNVLATYFLLFNCADSTVDGHPNPFVDPAVRRAFALALDARTLVDHVLNRGDRVARSFVPPDMIADYDPPIAPESDVSRAREVLASAGYADGVGLPPIDLLCTQRDQRLLQAIARQWEQALHVRVQLRVLETKTFAEEKASRRFMVSTGNWYGDYFDPTTFLTFAASDSGNNDAGYSNAAYDSLLEEARTISDPELRMSRLAQAETIIVQQDLPLIPILHYAEPIAIQAGVTGLYPNPRLWFPFRLVGTRP